MKVFMKYLVFFSIFLTPFIICSQADKNVIDAEKQARVMILQSAQAIQSFDTLIKSKENEKTISERILEWYEVVLDNNMNEYEKARDQNIPVIPYDAIVSRWNYYQFDDLSGLEKLSYNNIVSTELTIATLNKMSAIDQWKYFHENVKKPHITSPAQFISYLECKLADHKQILQDSVHAARSHRLAQFWLSLCMYPKNFIKYQQQILEKLSQEEDELRYYRDEYQLINSELKELWDGDEQAALTDRRAQLTIKLLQQDSINSFQQQHKILQSFVNEKILAIGMAKVAERKQAKKERKLMATEELVMQNFLVDEQREQESQVVREQVDVQDVIEKMMQEVIERQDLFARDQQMLLQNAQQEKQEAARQAKKEKDRVKKQRQNQAKKLKQQVVQSVVQEQESVVLQDEAKPLMTYDQFVVNVQKNKKNRLDYIEKLKATASLTTTQKAHLLFEYDKNIPDKSIFDLLWAYGNHVCHNDISDECFAQLEEFAKLIVNKHEQILLDNQHMSWYMHFDKKLYSEIYDRYQYLHAKYGSNNGVAKNKEKADEFLSHFKNIEIALAQYNKSLAIIKNELKKMKSDPAVEESILASKIKEMRELLEIVQMQNELLEKLDGGYKFFNNKVRDAKVYDIMHQFHFKGGILDTARLSSDIDFSTWADSTFAPGILETKMDPIKNEIAQILDKKNQLVLQGVPIADVHKQLIELMRVDLLPLLKSIWIEIGLLREDYDQLSYEIIGLYTVAQKQVFDTDNLEFYLHNAFMDYANNAGRNYSLAQVNDVTKVQMLLLQYFSSAFSK